LAGKNPRDVGVTDGKKIDPSLFPVLPKGGAVLEADAAEGRLEPFLGQGVLGQENAVDDFHIPVELKIPGQGLEEGLGLAGGDGKEDPIARLDGLTEGFPGAAPFPRFHSPSFRVVKTIGRGRRIQKNVTHPKFEYNF
jgi:hypothetical protein